MKKRSNGEWLKNELAQFLKDQGLEKEIKRRKVWNYWGEIAGPYVDQVTEVASFKKGILVVNAASSVWIQELVPLRKILIEKINQLIEPGTEKVKNILFRVKTLGKRKIKKVKFPPLSESRFDGLILDEKTKAGIENQVSEIEDKNTREQIRNFLVTVNLDKMWKEINGYRKCKKCGSMHNDKEDICKYCQMKKEEGII